MKSDLRDSELHVALSTAHPDITKQDVTERDTACLRGGGYHERSDCISGRQSGQPPTHGASV